MPVLHSDNVRHMPRDNNLDSSFALLRDGYTFISKRCQRYRSDVFQTRLQLQKTICMCGREAAEIFYNHDHFMRAGACPVRVQKTLFGQGGVQGLDGAEHRHRKAMFMALMTTAEITRLVDIATVQWRAYVDKWTTMETVVLFDELNELLYRTVCAWSGVPLEQSGVAQRTREMTAMIDGAGALTVGYVRARLARRHSEHWAAGLIRRVRSRRLELSEECALFLIAWHRNLKGDLMNEHDAAVELINVLRPTVAVARYGVFCALALHAYPAWREALRGKDSSYLDIFVQEVRRFYPFFPFVAARVRSTFAWHGYEFPQGTRALLDLYGTNHDAAIWKDPHTFLPERFSQRENNCFDFIPQGVVIIICIIVVRESGRQLL